MKKTIILVSLIIAAAVAFYGIRYLNKPLNSVDSVLQTREEKVTARAFIIRDESVFTSPGKGTVYRNVSEGERVANNAVISTVYYGNADSDTLQELSAVDKKIADARLDEQKQTRTSASKTDSVSVESRIETVKASIIDAAQSNDIKTIRSLKNELKSLRGIDISDGESGTVEDLERQKKLIEDRIGGGKAEITTDRAGIFTTFFDGMESVLTLENAQNYSVSDFKSLKSAESYTASDSVEKNSPVAKVVNNHIWYVMALVDMSAVPEIKEGTSVTLRFENIPGEEVSAEIIKISETEDNEAVILFESSFYLEGAYSIRESNADIVFSSHSGYIVPSTAVVDNDGVTGVWAESKNIKDFYPVEVLMRYYDEDEFLIASPEDAKNQLADTDRIYIERK